MHNDSLALEYVTQGINLMKVSNYSKAKEYFTRAIEQDKHYKDAYMHLGNAYANLDKLDEAKRAFDKVLLIDDNDGEAYFNIGNIYILKNDICKCIEYYNKAEEKGFKHVELYCNLAGIYREMEDEHQAIRNLTKAIRVEPLRGDIRLEKAYVYISNGKFNEALETLEELQKIIPDAFEAYDLQSQIYCGLKQYDKALELITSAVERFDKDAVLLLIKIKILIEMGSYTSAREEIKKLKESEFFELVAREVSIQESIINSVEQNIDAAISSLEYALTFEKETVDEQLRYLLMNLYLSQKKFDKALENAKALGDTKSNSLFCVSGMYYAPHIWKLQGKTEEAHDRFKKLSSIYRKLSIATPEFYEAYLYRLMCHKELGEFDKALELAEYIENLYPERSDAFAMRYAIYTDMGEKEKAEEEKCKALSLNPNLNI